MVKKSLAATALFMCLSMLVVGQTLEDFNDLVDFGTTIKDLHNAAAGGELGALPDSFLVLDGTDAAREVINGDRNDYLGELQFVSGEWIGVEQVIMYRCILQLEGPEFASAIPARRSRNPNPAEITLNSRQIVIAKTVDIRQREDGSFIPVLRVYHVRRSN